MIDEVKNKQEEIKQVEENEEEKEDKNRVLSTILIIIIIILILIIFWLLMSWKNSNDKKELSGNGDIFDIGCNCPQKTPEPSKTPIEDDSNNQTTPPGNNNGNSNNNGNNNTGNGNNNGSSDNENDGDKDDGDNGDTGEGGDGGDTEEGWEPADPDDVIVSDEDIIWESTNKLRIFKNPVYDMEEIIAPGSSNSYKFVIRNTGNCSLVYQLKFSEENRHNINMKYRLKKNGKYLNSNWVSVEDLTTVNMPLALEKKDDYILEWKWFESANDTAIGAAIDSAYRLNVDIIGKQKVS